MSRITTDPISISFNSLTASPLSLSQTWNTVNSLTAFTINITDTASDPSSKFVNLILNGSSKFSISKDGSISTSGNIYSSNLVQSISGSNINHTNYPTTSAVYHFVNESVLNAGASIMPSFTNNGNGSITIGDGRYVFASDNIGSPPYRSYNIPSQVIPLVNNELNYILARYNNGSPDIIASTTNLNVNNLTEYPIFVVALSGTDIGYLDLNHEALGLANKLALRISRTQNVEPEEGGLILGTINPARTITITAGDVWFGSSFNRLSALNSSVTPARFWRHSGGQWTYLLDPQFNFEAWDNGTNLVELTNNRYAVTYVYRSIGENSNIIHFIVGRGDYNLGQAQAATVPSDKPLILRTALFVGRIITKKFTSVPTQVDSAFDIPFLFTGVTDHNALANLQGGLVPDNFFHLTDTEYTNVQNLLSAISVSGGNISATGTSNVLPNQTANTDDSIMTRELGDSRYDMLIYGGHEWFIAAQSTTATIGTGASGNAVNIIGSQTLTGTLSGSGASSRHGDFSWSATGITGQNWPLNVPCEFVVSGVIMHIPSSAGFQKLRFMIGQLGAAPQIATADAFPLSGNGFGAEFFLSGTNLMGHLFYQNGATQVTGPDINHGGPWNNNASNRGAFRMTHDGTGNIAYYLSPLPNIAGRGTKPLPSTPSSTISAGFSAGQVANGRYFSLEAVNHSTINPPAGACRLIGRNVYIRCMEL